MRHEVVWSRAAYQNLQKIWDDAADREMVAHAIDEIQESLSENAQQAGESRADGSRVLFAPPLGIAFWANERTTVVEVRAVWSFGQV